MKLSKQEYRDLSAQKYWADRASTDYNKTQLARLERIRFNIGPEGLAHLPFECFTIQRMRFVIAQHQNAILKAIVESQR